MKGFYERLLAEVAAWRDEGIISAEQAQAIARRYRTEAAAESEERASAHSGRFVSTIAILGSALLGIGIILFFAANWQSIPREGKLALVIFSIISVNYAGYTLWFTRGSYPRTGHGLLFLGMILFGSGIFLVAQAYNITAHFPNGFLLWGLGILPAVYLLKSRVGASLAVVVSGTWLGLETFYGLGGTSSLLNLRFALLYVAFGMFLFVFGKAHEGRGEYSRIGGVFSGIGLFVVMLATYLMTFKFFGDLSGVLYELKEQSPLTKPVLVYMALAALTVVIAGAQSVVRGRNDRASEGILILALVLTAVTALNQFYPDTRTYGDNSFRLYPVVYNLLLMTEILSALAYGYFLEKPWAINAGLIIFVLLVAARYFDFFWGLMPRSLFFMVGGAVLITGGIFLERKRRKVIEAMRRGGREAA